MISRQKRLVLMGFVLTVFIVCSLFYKPQKSLALSWEQVGTSGLGGGATNQTAVRLVEFNDELYVSVGNIGTGVEVFRSSDGQT